MHLGKCIGIGTALFMVSTLCPMSYGEEASATEPTVSLGVSVKPLNSSLREEWGYRGAGVLVTEVELGSPAELAGIVRGDVLVVLGAVPIRSEGDLAEVLVSAAPDEPLSVVIARDKGRTLRIVNLDLEGPPVPAPIGESALEPLTENGAVTTPAEAQAQVIPRPSEADATKPQPITEMALGVRCETLSSELGAALGVSVAQGVMVLAVVSPSPAQLAGIRPGDVISHVGTESITSAEELAKAVSGSHASLVVRVHRHDEERDLAVNFGAASLDEPDTEKDRVVAELLETIRVLRLEVQSLRLELEDLKSQ